MSDESNPDFLRAPLAAYRTACEHPGVLDPVVAAAVLADNVEAFLAAQIDPSAEYDRLRDLRVTRQWIVDHAGTGHDCGSCGTTNDDCLARLVEHGGCCARCEADDMHGAAS